jgi:hypothetical protein
LAIFGEEGNLTPAPILPAFYMPIAETGVSPWLDLAREQVWLWIESFGLTPTDSARQHLERTAADLLAARFYPGAGPDLLPALAQFCVFGFLSTTCSTKEPMAAIPNSARRRLAG